MFTGIVERLGRVRHIERSADAAIMDLETGYNDLALGESVAVDGACLTVADGSEPAFARFFVSYETLARTTLGGLVEGGPVNLERAASLSTRLSGHLVQGHVDAVGEVERITPRGDSIELALALPATLYRYCVEKGSIAISGISLTLNAVSALEADGQFRIGLTIIPHTWTATTLKHARPGSRVNIEVDVMAKYVERLCQPYLTP
ncbi:MAG: riboflavin synthase [Caulobacteraceae bacterium]